MLRSADDASSSSSLAMLPLCDLLTAYQKQTLVSLDNYLFQLTQQLDDNLHKAFTEAREQIGHYLKKSTFAGLKSVFNGFEAIIADDCYDPAKTLSPKNKSLLIELVKVYKAYALQQFDIQALIRKIRALEFNSSVYQAATQRRDAAEAILVDDKTENIITELHNAIDDFDIRATAKNNQITHAYRDLLVEVNASVFKQLCDEYKTLENQFEMVSRQQYSAINTDISFLNGRFVHDLPLQMESAAVWVSRSQLALADLRSRKHAVKTPAALAEVERDISEFLAEYKQTRDQFIEFENTLNRQRALLDRRQQDYLKQLKTSKADLAVSIGQLLVKINAPDQLPALPLCISNIGYQAQSLDGFQAVENAWQENEKLKAAVKEKIEDVVALRNMIDEYLKSSLHSRAAAGTSSKNVETFESKWSDIETHYRDILNTPIQLGELKLDKKQLDGIRQQVNITEELVTYIREINVSTEIACIQRDAQIKFVSIDPRLRDLFRRLEAPANHYRFLCEQLFSDSWDELQALYDAAVEARDKELQQMSAALNAFAQRVDGHRSEFLDLPAKPAVVLNKRVLLQLDTQIGKLQVPAKKWQAVKPSAPVEIRNDAVYQSSVSVAPVIVRQRPGFLRRHWISLAATTAASSLLGAGVGFVLGWFLAPVTLGLSVPVLAGIGAVAGAGIGAAAGLLTSLITCKLYDSCKHKKPASEDKAPLMSDVGCLRTALELDKGNSVKVTAAVSAQQAADDLQKVCENIGDLVFPVSRNPSALFSSSSSGDLRPAACSTHYGTLTLAASPQHPWHNK